MDEVLLPDGGFYTTKIEVHIQTYYSSSQWIRFLNGAHQLKLADLNGGTKTGTLDNGSAPNGWYTIANGGGLCTSFDISCWRIGFSAK